MSAGGATTIAGRSHRSRHAAVGIVIVLGVVVALVVPALSGSERPVEVDATASSQALATDPVPGVPRHFVIDQSGDNARTTIERSLGCDAAGGEESYWHSRIESALPAGILTGATSNAPGDLRAYVDVHSPSHAIRVIPEPTPAAGDPSAFLLPDASHVAMSNRRGTVKLGLSAGGCDDLAVGFDGVHATIADGAWTIVSRSGSYRGAQGSGSFTLADDVAPGADNHWRLQLAGDIAVLQPALDARVVSTFWDFYGANYALRQVSVRYEITNVGAGDAFDVHLTKAVSPTPGVALIGPIDGNTNLTKLPIGVGDIAAGDTASFVLLWQLPLPSKNPPCKLVVLGCEFQTTLTLTVPDALDVPATATKTVTAKAPDLPPPT